MTTHLKRGGIQKTSRVGKTNKQIVSETDGVRNIGKLKIKNAETAGIETLTPFKFSEVFITAEDQADVTYPGGIEITRIKFK